MTLSSKFSKFTRTGIAAIIIASSSALAVAPAQAGNSASFQYGNGNAAVQLAHYRAPVRRYCDNNRQIRRKFRQDGFRNISFGRNRGNWVVVRADRGRWSFTFRTNRCNGRVNEINRVRNWPNYGGNGPHNGNGGYNGGINGGGGSGNWTWQFQYNF